MRRGAEQPDSPAEGDPGLRLQTVAIIGAGAAGREFALLCASMDYDTILEDVMPANLRRAEEAYTGLELGGSLRFALTVDEAVRQADLVVDFVPDELESKLEIFCMVDRMAPPRTILLTPTETLSIADLASCTYRPERAFALRGGLREGVRLVCPEGALGAARAAVEGFLARLGFRAIVEPETRAPMLVKNYL